MRDTLKGTIKAAFQAYIAIYDALCGPPPWVRPWHFQWHALRELNRDLTRTLPRLRGRVLDLGCGRKPYASLLAAAQQHIGCDIVDGPKVDVLIAPEQPLPFADNAFDAVFSSQVFEHVADLDFTLREIRRVLKPEGLLVVSVPFLYQVHGIPHDYRRLSEYGATQLLKGFSMQALYKQGAIGSTLAMLLLGWINTQLGSNVLTWACKALLLPLWIPFCLIVNLIGLLMDTLDTTGGFYHNLLFVARRDSPPQAHGRIENENGYGHA